MEQVVIDTLSWATRKRVEIKNKLDVLNEELRQVNTVAKDIMKKNEVVMWQDRLGTLTIKSGYDVTTLKRDRLIVAMLRHGITAATVDEIIKEGSEVKTRAECVEFRIVAEE